MSSKVVYQTLYGSEHLFRLPTETLADWGEPLPAAAELPVVPEPPAVPPVRFPQMAVSALTDMVLPTAPPLPPQVSTAEPVVAIPVLSGLVEPLANADLLVQDTTPPSRKEPDPKPALIKHKVLILADEDLSPSDLLFLERILKAVNLDISGVDLLNLYGVSEIDFGALLRHKYINHFITFGVPFQRINLDILMDRYHPLRYDGITFLMADSLPVIEASQPLKKLLWNSLKRVFEL